MNSALKKLDEIGCVELVQEYAQGQGLKSVDVVFSYSKKKREVTAEVIDESTGRSAQRVEGLAEFVAHDDMQDDRALSMLMACVDELAEIANEPPAEQAANDAFFKAFPSLAPGQSLSQRRQYAIATNSYGILQIGQGGTDFSRGQDMTVWSTQLPPVKAKPSATIPPPEAGQRPKRKILD